MTITLPDDPALAALSEAELRLDLACALFAAGRVVRSVAARIAGLDSLAFDEEIFRRRIPPTLRRCWRKIWPPCVRPAVVTVVSDTSVLLNLCYLGEARLLPEICGIVLAPPEVRVEFDRLAARRPSLLRTDLSGMGRRARATVRPAGARFGRRFGFRGESGAGAGRRTVVPPIDRRGSGPARRTRLGPSRDGAAWRARRSAQARRDPSRRSVARSPLDRRPLLDSPAPLAQRSCATPENDAPAMARAVPPLLRRPAGC